MEIDYVCAESHIRLGIKCPCFLRISALVACSFRRIAAEEDTASIAPAVLRQLEQDSKQAASAAADNSPAMPSDDTRFAAQAVIGTLKLGQGQGMVHKQRIAQLEHSRTADRELDEQQVEWVARVEQRERQYAFGAIVSLRPVEPTQQWSCVIALRTEGYRQPCQQE